MVIWIFDTKAYNIQHTTTMKHMLEEQIKLDI